MKSRITRRDFIIRSSQTMIAAAAIPGFIRPDEAGASTVPDPEKLKLRDILNHFGVTENVILETMKEALSCGGDYCDVYFQHEISSTVGLEDQKVNRAHYTVGLGAGIRVLKGDQTGYSYTEELTPKALKLAAKTASVIAGSGKTLPPQALGLHVTPRYYPIERPWEEVSIDQKVPILQTINNRIFELDSRIIKSNIWLSSESGTVLIATSEGRLAFDYRPMIRITASCTAEQNGKRETNSFNLSGRRGIEFLTPENVERLAREAVSRTTVLFGAVKPEAGEMPVVLAAGSSGILLHEAIGHGMEADFNRKNISIFSDKIGKPVAESFVTIVDDGTNPNIRGSLNIDDEANDTEKTILVENGILKSYLHDRISSRFYGVKPTGNGRRESFRHPVQPRMRNTYMENGPHTRDEIIASVKKGLYAETFTNGEVYIGAGDFTFYVKSGALIEDGKITAPVKDINIIGNGPEVLKNIIMVGNDMIMAEGGWTCGKNGQGVPVSQGQPTVLVSKITVGGLRS